MKLILCFNDSINAVKPAWILFVGLGLAGWGESQKYKGKGSL